MSAHLAEAVQRNSGHVRTAEYGDLAVSVFSDDEGVHASAVHAEMLAKAVFQPGGIQHGSGADHPVFRHPAQFQRRVGQDIHRVRHDQKNTLVVPLCDLGNDAFKNLHILMYQIQPGFLRLLICSRSHNDHGGIHDIVIVSRINFHLSGKGNTVSDVQRFPFRLLPVRVDQNQLGKKAALHQTEGRCRPHKAAADDGRLSVIDHLFHIVSFPPRLRQSHFFCYFSLSFCLYRLSVFYILPYYWGLASRKNPKKRSISSLFLRFSGFSSVFF